MDKSFLVEFLSLLQVQDVGTFVGYSEMCQMRGGHLITLDEDKNQLLSNTDYEKENLQWNRFLVVN